jgi:glycosyltransferase involved in cell wall biosynthesis
MSMGLPCISTNWSGITAFLDESVGYPLAVDQLVGAPSGGKWAQPSAFHLRQLMRRVVGNRDEARARGAAARRRMVERYSPDAIARVLLREWRRVEAKLAWTWSEA